MNAKNCTWLGHWPELVDDAAFHLHVQMPHTVRFIAADEQLLGRHIEGQRSHVIGGGASAGAAGLWGIRSGEADGKSVAAIGQKRTRLEPCKSREKENPALGVTP